MGYHNSNNSWQEFPTNHKESEQGTLTDYVLLFIFAGVVGGIIGFVGMYFALMRQSIYILINTRPNTFYLLCAAGGLVGCGVGISLVMETLHTLKKDVNGKNSAEENRRFR
ncbi:MAG TPA: hypothetical protein PLB62_13695 [Candidatus Sumerlaeota bacterium]|nr:hypothetical protein [Candidatus Sumerlaeota bacterium]